MRAAITAGRLSAQLNVVNLCALQAMFMLYWAVREKVFEKEATRCTVEKRY